jgi:hypothetical protein
MVEIKMTKHKVFFWDEVGYEISTCEIELPDGLTPRQVIVLADDKVSEDACDNYGVYDKKIRTVGDVTILDGLFGHDKVTRSYWCPSDPESARKLAENELSAMNE